MSSECACAAGRRRGSRGRVASSLTLALGVALALVPKCPLCLAAYLSLFGVGMAAAGAIAPWCLPLGVLLVVSTCLAFVRSRRALAASG